MHLQDATFSGNSAPTHPGADSYTPRSSGPNVYIVGTCGELGEIYVYPGCNIRADSSGTEEK